MDLLTFVTSELPPAPARVLEVGCGQGELALTLDEHGHRVTAIDPAAPEGDIFRAVSLAEFESAERFDAAVASRSLHHIADLGAAVEKLHGLIRPGGRLIVFEHAPERLDERTARWFLGKHHHNHPGDPPTPEAWLTRWKADHAGLHSGAALLRELGRRFEERRFSWAPYLHRELGEDDGDEERRLIEAGEIQATGFVYVGEPR